MRTFGRMEQGRDSVVKSNICLVLLCGLPASGKTSLAGVLRRRGRNSHADISPGGLLQEPASILHLCYDDVIPRQLVLEENTSSDDASPDPGPSHVSPWKTHRREILHCVDWLLGRLRTEEVSDLDAVLEKSWTHIDGLQLSEIAAKVWSGILSLFQGQLRERTKQTQEHASPLSLGERRDCPASTVVFVIDDNMYYRSMRYEYYQLARKHNTGLCLLYLHCSAEAAVTRNGCRSDAVSTETILKMAKHLEEPDGQLAKWETQSIRLEADQIDAPHIGPQVWTLICEALQNPAAALEEDNSEEKEASRAECAASIVHQADRSLRRCVATAMAAAKEEGLLNKAELRDLASRLNAIRQEILQGMREGRIRPPALDPMDCVDGEKKSGDFDGFLQSLFHRRQKER